MSISLQTNTPFPKPHKMHRHVTRSFTGPDIGHSLRSRNSSQPGPGIRLPGGSSLPSGTMSPSLPPPMSLLAGFPSLESPAHHVPSPSPPSTTAPASKLLKIMKVLGIRSVGLSLSLSLSKGLPLGSGLGSSAASAAMAVSALFGSPLDELELVRAGLESERKVSGYHEDNIAPAVMGGFVLIRSYQPLDLMRHTCYLTV